MNVRDAYEKFGFDLIESGSRFKMLCPFVPEKTPSFVIYEDLGFHCFSCGAHGTYKNFLTRIGEDGDNAYLFTSPDMVEEKTFLDVKKLKNNLTRNYTYQFMMNLLKKRILFGKNLMLFG